MRIRSEDSSGRPAAAASASATVDFPLAGEPGDAHDVWQSRPPGEALGQLQQLVRASCPLLRAGAVELGRAQEVDLRAHQRAHRAEEREQAVAARVAAARAVAAHQRASELVVAPGHVHDQEREVVADVGHAEPAIELDAVDGLDALAEQDVLGAQVAVAVAHAARARPPGELGSEAGQRGAAEAREGGQLTRRRAARRRAS